MTEPTSRDESPGRARAWPWLLVLVVALVVGVLLAWRPWAEPRATGDPAGTPSSTGSATATTEPATPAPAAGAAGFDAGTAATLFLTDAELAQAVPDAAGLSLADAEEAVWGLPQGSAVDPPGCTPAVTIVEEEPETFLRRFASDEAVTVIQSVMVLPDDAAASAAFEVLVRTLEQCDTYEQHNPGVDGGAWTGDPPETDRGVVPSVVRRLTLTAEGATSPEIEVTVLAGDALVTTTASGVDPAADPADPDVLAEVARASAQRALQSLAP
ncbi:sensor domain-containing protein [Cellulomonas sp. Marseille-Q8402]